jgi:hypothetical protein
LSENPLSQQREEKSFPFFGPIQLVPGLNAKRVGYRFDAILKILLLGLKSYPGRNWNAPLSIPSFFGEEILMNVVGIMKIKLSWFAQTGEIRSGHRT